MAPPRTDRRSAAHLGLSRQSQKEISMTQHSHQTAPTQFVEANAIRFAYRRFGKPGGAPLVFNQHFRGTMDYWDPAVTDGLARNREVILFNNAGAPSGISVPRWSLSPTHLKGSRPWASLSLNCRLSRAWASI
jgi:hypothetical protein